MNKKKLSLDKLEIDSFITGDNITGGGTTLNGDYSIGCPHTHYCNPLSVKCDYTHNFTQDQACNIN